ncbi:MAG TPA: hypothetical protein VF989_17240 [Polyangiaceae bacterium]
MTSGAFAPPLRALSTGVWLSLLPPLACSSRPPASAENAPADPLTCEERQADLVRFVAALPERALATSLSVELPRGELGRIPGTGAVLEIGTSHVALNEHRTSGGTLVERAARAHEWIAAWRQSTGTGDAERPTLYLAAAADVDVRTVRAFLRAVPADIDLRLLVRAEALPAVDGASTQAQELAARLLTEPDAAARRALARQGYASFSSCSALAAAVESVETAPAGERWLRLRTALGDALPRCACDELDAGSLKSLLSAEQRAGTLSLGALPASFLRDERCGASMPLRSMAKLVKQVEAFDREFSGQWQKDALEFDDVVTDERLLVYFCDALPGETLASLQRARAQLFVRVAEGGACQAWQFEPLSPGAPMGTWRRADGEALAFHYRQAAEELRLFGPVADAQSRPTDAGPWACDDTYRLVGVDAHSIAVKGGRWFMDAATCAKAAAADVGFAGCVGALARGVTESDGEGTDAAGEGMPR